MSQKLGFSNQYKSAIKVAIAWVPSNAPDKKHFLKRGWLDLGSGQKQDNVLSGELAKVNPVILYYAIANDGSKKWDGQGSTQYITGVNPTASFGGNDGELWDTPEDFQVSFVEKQIPSTGDILITIGDT